MNKVLDFKDLPTFNSHNINIYIYINNFFIKFLKATENKNPYIFNFRK